MVANREVALVVHHLLSLRKEEKYSLTILKDKKENRCQALAEEAAKTALRTDSIIRDCMILPDVQIKSGMEHLFILLSL